MIKVLLLRPLNNLIDKRNFMRYLLARNHDVARACFCMCGTMSCDGSGDRRGVVRIPRNITVTPDSRIIMSLHPFYYSPKNRVVELTRNGDLIPFPDAA